MSRSWTMQTANDSDAPSGSLMNASPCAHHAKAQTKKHPKRPTKDETLDLLQPSDHLHAAVVSLLHELDAELLKPLARPVHIWHCRKQRGASLRSCFLCESVGRSRQLQTAKVPRTPITAARRPRVAADFGVKARSVRVTVGKVCHLAFPRSAMAFPARSPKSPMWPHPLLVIVAVRRQGFLPYFHQTASKLPSHLTARCGRSPWAPCCRCAPGRSRRPRCRGCASAPAWRAD